MKVLYLPLNSPEVKQTGMVDAFNQYGVDLTVFDFNMKFIQHKSPKIIRSELLKTVSVIKPDLMHMQLQFTSTIDSATIAEAKRISPKTIITNWTGDVRKDVPKTFVQTSKAVDISLISSVGQLNMYKNALGNRSVKYWQIGFNPKLYFPKNENKFKYHTVFAASNHVNSGFPGYPERKKAVSILYNQFGQKFGLFGYGWKKYRSHYVQQHKINDVYNQSATCISISNFNNLSHYFSDRLLMCLASGRPTICLAFPGWQSYFTDNYDIVIVRSAAEIPEKIKWLIKNPDIANKIGQAGARTAFAEHTYFSRVKELFHIVGLT